MCVTPKAPQSGTCMYEEYKATRQKMPEALQVQIPYILRIVEALGIPTLVKEGQEADDIIAQAARRFKKDARVTIISGDKDLMQLVDEAVTVWDTLKEKVYDREAVKEKYGVYPEYIADLLAIMGDSSDNIPGVPGIGEKGALDLISKYGHVSDIIEHAQAIESKKAREAILNHTDKALLSLDLARLDREVAMDIDLSNMRMKEMDVEKLSSLFMELEFRALQAGLAGDTPKASAVFEGTIEYACNPFDIDRGRDVRDAGGLFGSIPWGAHLCLQGKGCLPRSFEAAAISGSSCTMQKRPWCRPSSGALMQTPRSLIPCLPPTAVMLQPVRPP